MKINTNTIKIVTVMLFSAVLAASSVAQTSEFSANQDLDFGFEYETEITVTPMGFFQSPDFRAYYAYQPRLIKVRNNQPEVAAGGGPQANNFYYEYDDEGNITKRVNYRIDENGDEVLLTYQEFAYSGQEQVFQRTLQYSEGEVIGGNERITEFDEEENTEYLILRNWSPQMGEIVNNIKQTRLFDEMGNVTELRLFNWNIETEEWIEGNSYSAYEYEYNDKGLMISMARIHVLFGTGTPQSLITYEYDEEDRLKRIFHGVWTHLGNNEWEPAEPFRVNEFEYPEPENGFANATVQITKDRNEEGIFVPGGKLVQQFVGNEFRSIESKAYQWDAENEDWIPSNYSGRHHFDDGTTESIFSAWWSTENSEWTFDGQNFENTYEDGKLTLVEVQEYYDNDIVYSIISVQFEYDVTTSIDEGTTDLPEALALNQNYPNPFNPATNISYTLPSDGNIRLDVFNIQGQLVSTLVNGYQASGSHTVSFDASALASGIYLYRLTSAGQTLTKKMMLVK